MARSALTAARNECSSNLRRGSRSHRDGPAVTHLCAVLTVVLLGLCTHHINSRHSCFESCYVFREVLQVQQAVSLKPSTEAIPWPTKHNLQQQSKAQTHLNTSAHPIPACTSAPAAPGSTSSSAARAARRALELHSPAEGSSTKQDRALQQGTILLLLQELSLRSWESPSWLPREQNPLFPWQLQHWLALTDVALQAAVCSTASVRHRAVVPMPQGWWHSDTLHTELLAVTTWVHLLWARLQVASLRNTRPAAAAAIQHLSKH